jgi:2-(1,2-epoxy-1,2-dihydrophenyl)acetyl-CoA isomerase
MSIVTYLDDDAVLTITIDRIAARNAIDDDMMRALIDAFEGAATDNVVRVIVLQGAGDDFCSGADLVARNAESDAPKPRAGSIQRRVPTLAHRLIPLILRVQVPVVCKVRGWAAGIGLHLALAADFTVVAADARLWEPFMVRGFTPDSGGTWLLPRRVGETRAREMLLLAREISGTEAAEWGAVHRAVPDGELDRVVDELVARLASGPTVALGLTKWLVNEGAATTLDPQLANEAFALELSSRTADFREGLAAMREKRSPRFEGR